MSKSKANYPKLDYLVAKPRIKNPTQDVTLTGDLPTETESNITHSLRGVNGSKRSFSKDFRRPKYRLIRLTVAV